MADLADQNAVIIQRAQEIRGFADQFPLWGLFVQTEPLLREFVLGNVGLPPYSENFNNAALVNGARILCHGRQGEAPASDQLLLLATIGESLFLNLRNKRLPEAEARALLRLAMSQTLDYPDADVAAAIRAKAVGLYPNLDDDEALKNAIRGGSAENAMLILVEGMNEHYRKNPTFGTDLLLQTVLSIVKTGECTVEFLTKIKEGCALFGYTIQPDKDLIKVIYLTFGEYISSRDVESMITYWKTQVPNKCLRIKLTIDQAEWHNLTSYVSIQTAITTHQDFYWVNLFSLTAYSSQLVKYKEARQIVGNDRYYGFNQDLGAVSSTKYKDLAGACILILIKVDNDRALRKYKGMANKINNFAFIKFLIKQYMKATVTNAQKIDIPEERKQALVNDLVGISPGFTIGHVQSCEKPFRAGDETDSDEE